jgi:hypothetical protein
LDFDGIVAGWDTEEKEKMAKKEGKCASPLTDVLERTINSRNAHQFHNYASK